MKPASEMTLSEIRGLFILAGDPEFWIVGHDKATRAVEIMEEMLNDIIVIIKQTDVSKDRNIAVAAHAKARAPRRKKPVREFEVFQL